MQNKEIKKSKEIKKMTYTIVMADYFTVFVFSMDKKTSCFCFLMTHLFLHFTCSNM